MGSKMRGGFLALTAPTGAGKGTIARNLLGNEPIRFRLLTSQTTRPPRSSDLQHPLNSGWSEYAYRSLEEFRRMQEENAFEWSDGNVHGAAYGTLRATIDDAIDWRLKLGWDGWTIAFLHASAVTWFFDALRKRKSEHLLTALFVTAPSEEILVHRLMRRDGLSEEKARQRVEQCSTWERDARQSGLFREFIVNKDEKAGFAVRATVEVCRIIEERSPSFE